MAVALAVVVVLKTLVAVALAGVLAQEVVVEAQHVLVVVEAQHVLVVVVERIHDHNHRRIFSLQLT